VERGSEGRAVGAQPPLGAQSLGTPRAGPVTHHLEEARVELHDAFPANHLNRLVAASEKEADDPTACAIQRRTAIRDFHG
jgi:hypothetical protein